MIAGPYKVEHVRACSQVEECFAVALRYDGERTETIHYCPTMERARGYAEQLAESYEDFIGVGPKIVLLKVRHEAVEIYKPTNRRGGES
ncbi:MAG: hypothetical protein J6V72_12790 [Kiritimatiellae bacterium]|nr:hypothetical protein [Kiritimatiellia bacterium]